MPETVSRRALLSALGVGAVGACATVNDAHATPRVLETPDAAFERLPDFAFAPHFATIRDDNLGRLRIHYTDEGPRNAPAIVLLHGQPSWSYLYRHQIAHLSRRGYRVIAVDLVGYGRSDKPSLVADHSYAGHVQWMTSFFQSLSLNKPNVVVHDWGGLIGLPILAENPDRFGRLVVLNTSLPDGSDPTTPEYDRAFDAWIRFLQTAPKIEPSRVIEAQTLKTLSAAEAAAYDAPYISNDLTAGPRAMSALVPRRPADPFAARNAQVRQQLKSWPNPVLIAFSADSNRLHPGQHALFSGLFKQQRIWRDVEVPGTQHFLLEDAPELISALIDDFIAETKL
jgi:haloalkane dehalogenase